MGSLPSSSKESMTSENVDQTFISKQFDFLNDEVYLIIIIIIIIIIKFII
jgi:hypothetical protein